MSDTFDAVPRQPDPSPDGTLSSPVKDCRVYAHQSSIGAPDVLNVEIDAPAGVTVRIHINDGAVYEDVIAR